MKWRKLPQNRKQGNVFNQRAMTSWGFFFQCRSRKRWHVTSAKRLVDSVFPPPVQNLNGAEMLQLKWSPEEVMEAEKEWWAALKWGRTGEDLIMRIGSALSPPALAEQHWSEDSKVCFTTKKLQTGGCRRINSNEAKSVEVFSGRVSVVLSGVCQTHVFYSQGFFLFQSKTSTRDVLQRILTSCSSLTWSEIKWLCTWNNWRDVFAE